jgi:putative transposase
LELAAPEREQLWQIVNLHRTPQQIALKARIILLPDEGYNHREIARALHISREMALLWRNRWLELSVKNLEVVQRLADAERLGDPMTLSLEQILQLFALACEKPEISGRPLSHWSVPELADEALFQGISR